MEFYTQRILQLNGRTVGEYYLSKKGPRRKKVSFNNCCNSDLLSLLHGKLYRCPFSANGVNIKAFPDDKSDVVDLIDENISLIELKEMIKYLTFDKKYLTACSYCNGRDYRTEPITAAVQTKKPLDYKKIV